jgi:hypothetical protein
MSSRSPRRSIAILVFAALLLPFGAVLAEPMAHGGRLSAPVAHSGRLAAPAAHSGRLSALATAALQIPLIQFLVNLVIDTGSGIDGNGNS